MASMAVSVVLLPVMKMTRLRGVQLAQPAQHLQAGHVGQMHVEDDDIGVSLPGEVQPLRRRLGREDGDSRLAEGLAKGQQNRRFVINY